MAEITIEPVAGRYELGEGPHWDDISQKLYFVDIFVQKILRFDPETKEVTSVFIENGPVGCVIPVEGQPEKFIAGSATDVVLVNWDSNKNLEKCSFKKLVTVDTEKTGLRINDGKVDASGRLWAGTMAIEVGGVLKPNMGSFYTVGPDFKPKLQFSQVSISNGLAWNKTDDTFYYIDSLTYQITAYDYDASSATISNKRVVFDTKKNNITGIPDGMTIDRNGNLWVAFYLGSCILNINPNTGKVLQKIDLPAKNVTSVAFGGPNLDILYVTTSSYGLKEEELKDQPLAGYVFAIKGLGVQGYKANAFKLN